MRTRLIAVANLMALTCILGCGAPVVEIVHELPPAVPLPADAPLEAGEFTAQGPGAEWTPQYLRAELAKALTELSHGDGAHARRMGGRSTVAVEEDSGTRPARRWNAETGSAAPVELPYLVRRVAVRVTFEIAPGEDGQSLVVETRADYDSTRDPRVRGEYGLGRGDDPERAPPVEQVTRELLAQCVQEGVGMVEPVMMPVTLRFRLGGGTEGAAGSEAARKRDFPAATEHFRAAVAKRPDDAALRFNLGLALEGAGKFAAARRAYEAAAKAAGRPDAEAEQAAKRAAALARHTVGPAAE